MAGHRRPFDTSTTPLPMPDGRFGVELRFRIDASAPSERVTALYHTLRWHPERTTILFAIPQRGLRALRIEGRDVGEVYTFANRVADAIREIGDLVHDESPASTAPVPDVAVPPPDATAGGDVAARWTYEPPDAFLDAAAAETPTPRHRLRRRVTAFLRSLLRRD